MTSHDGSGLELYSVTSFEFQLQLASCGPETSLVDAGHLEVELKTSEAFAYQIEVVPTVTRSNKLVSVLSQRQVTQPETVFPATDQSVSLRLARF